MITSPTMPSADTTQTRSPEPPKPIRLLIVDDHPVLRAGLANLLQLESDFEVVGQAGSGEAAVRLWESVRPDICLLDLSMPGMGGLESLRRILGIAANARVLVLTSSESAADANSALQAGASGYLTKNVEHAEIVSTIRQAHAGTRGICRGVSAAITTSAPAILSPREFDVLHLLRRGSSNLEIGRALGITERTVKAHVMGIMEKLNAPDRAGAVAKGFDLGILKAVRMDEATRGD